MTRNKKDNDLWDLMALHEKENYKQETLFKKFKSVQKYMKCIQQKYIINVQIKSMFDEMEDTCDKCDRSSCSFGYKDCPIVKIGEHMSKNSNFFYND